MKRLMIEDCRLPICGSSTSNGHDGAWPSKKLKNSSTEQTRSVLIWQRFPSIGNGNRDFFQALEKLVVSVSNAWKTLAASELFRLPREAAQQNSPGEFCFCKISTTANRQSSISNRQFFINRKFL